MISVKKFLSAIVVSPLVSGHRSPELHFLSIHFIIHHFWLCFKAKIQSKGGFWCPGQISAFCALDECTKKGYSMVVFIFTGCCAVGSAPALGAGGREFESRHSDITKSHDEPFINAVLSWLSLLYKCSENSDLCLFALFLSFR